MLSNLSEKILWLLLGMVLLAMLALSVSNSASTVANGRSATTTKTYEKELATQARIVLLQKIYAPVEELRIRGELQKALFKLDELSRTYPGDPHGYIVKGEILQQLGTIEEAAASYVEGIKRNGDYVDKHNFLSRREKISHLVEEAERSLAPRAKASPGNNSLLLAMRNINYLKSRLAGGCE